MSKNEMIMLPRDVVDLALEAVTAAMSGGPYKHRCSDAIDALRKALEQQQNKQEPMRKMYVCNSCQFPYADQPPSQCDCLGDETYTEAWLCTSPKPRRTPLTDECIDAIAESMPGGLDGFLNGWGWRQFARAVLESAPQPPEHYDQQALDLCLTCGWKTLIPGDCCLNCARQKPPVVEQPPKLHPLPSDLYDSKDWRSGTYAERVEWLHTMYESAKEQIAELERPRPGAAPYLYYDPANGDTWTNEAINDGCCPPDGLIALYTKETK